VAELLVVAGWVVLVGLTVGPIFSAEKNGEEAGWTWIVAAMLLGPLAGIAYYLSRHAMRKVSRAQYLPKHAKAPRG
jgi:hypothetical protein